MTDATKQNQIEIPDFITVRELATLTDNTAITIIKELMSNGIMANINQQIDFDTASIVAGELGFEAVAKKLDASTEDETEIPFWRQILENEKDSNLIPRPPVITMLGHVDHGKTSLIDIIRTAAVQADEAGGITQHIGAYQTTHNNQLITVLDTPGHQAFTAMRERGAQATDIAILVVAADDGIMPQTKEAIEHARAANVPIIVALNKIDLPNARVDWVKQQLSEHGLTPHEWDGDTLIIPVSAKKNIGIDDLLEAILMTAEEITPKANPNGDASGTVIEARMEKGRGVMVTLLVQNGTLKTGNTVLIGTHFGKIKAMYNDKGKKVKTAAPSTPVSILGLSGIPTAGDQFSLAKNEKHARKLAARNKEAVEYVEHAEGPNIDDFFAKLQLGDTQTLNLIVKADVQGSLEPITDSLNKIEVTGTKINLLRATTGPITERDIMLASASNALILGFNTFVDPLAKRAASREKVETRTYTVIYKLLEDVEKSLKALLGPEYREIITGRAEVRQLFKIRSMTIAGCMMKIGLTKRRAFGRVVRDNLLIHTGEIDSLKHFQEDVREVRNGFEFGVHLAEFDEYEVGDLIEFFIKEEIKE